MIRHLTAVAGLEVVAALRLRWIRLLGLAFGVLAVACAHAAGSAADLGGADGFTRTTMALVPVVLILAPLSGLLLGVLGQSSDDDGDQFLFAQPVSRTTILVGRWLGEAAALSAAIGCGLGAGAAYILISAGAGGIAGFLLFIAAAVALGLVFLAIAAVIAAASTGRGTALAAATFAWFVFVLLYDSVALALATWLTGPVGARVLFASVFGNPADLMRVMTLTLAGSPNVLGAAGDAWNRFLGGPAWAAAASLIAIAGWIAAPLAAAALLLDRRDV